MPNDMAATSNTSRVRTAVIYGLSILLAFLFERAAEYLFAEPPTQKSGLQSILTATTTTYQKFTTLGYRVPRAHYVRIVSFDPRREPEELFSNLCQKRKLYARSITQIASANPALIVIDARFGPDACPHDDEGTRELKEAVVSAVRSGVPVVVGLDSKTRDELIKQYPDSTPSIKDDQLAGEASLDFGTQDRLLRFGLVRLNLDVRKIPINWPTLYGYSDTQGRKEPVLVPTLAFETARFYDNLLEQQPRMRKALSAEVHPYASFIAERGFPTFDVLDIVCGSENVPRTIDWTACRGGDYGRLAMRAHIVLISERIDTEFRDSVVGAVPGYILQANYIESLLDDRYFLPVNMWLQAVLSLFVFALIEINFKNFSPPGLALLISLGMLITIWFISWLILVFAGRFLAIVFPGLLALVGKYVNLKFEERRNMNILRTGVGVVCIAFLMCNTAAAKLLKPQTGLANNQSSTHKKSGGVIRGTKGESPGGNGGPKAQEGDSGKTKQSTDTGSQEPKDQRGNSTSTSGTQTSSGTSDQDGQATTAQRPSTSNSSENSNTTTQDSSKTDFKDASSEMSEQHDSPGKKPGQNGGPKAAKKKKKSKS